MGYFLLVLGPAQSLLIWPFLTSRSKLHVINFGLFFVRDDVVSHSHDQNFSNSCLALKCMNQNVVPICLIRMILHWGRRLMGSKKLHPGINRVAMKASFASFPASSVQRTSFWTSWDAAAPDESISSCSWLSVENGFNNLSTASSALANSLSLLRTSVGRTSWCFVPDDDPESMSAMLRVASSASISRPWVTWTKKAK